MLWAYRDDVRRRSRALSKQTGDRLYGGDTSHITNPVWMSAGILSNVGIRPERTIKNSCGLSLLQRQTCEIGPKCITHTHTHVRLCTPRVWRSSVSYLRIYHDTCVDVPRCLYFGYSVTPVVCTAFVVGCPACTLGKNLVRLSRVRVRWLFVS